MTSTFYKNAQILKGPKENPSPSKKDIHMVLEHLEDDSLRRYFFDDLDNPAWVSPLHNANFFISHIPSPKEDSNNPGFFSFPMWFAGEYLNRLAAQFPNVVKDVARHIDTNNARAIRTMLEAIRKIPPEDTAQIVGVFGQWFKTPFAASMMLAHEMGLILEHLSKGGQVEAALYVLNILLEPIPNKDRFKEGKIVAGTLHDLYWLNEAFTHNLPFLFEIDSIAVADILEKRLIEAIDLEVDPHIPEEKYPAYSYWRLNIRPDLGLGQPRDFKDLLVNILIRSLEVSCEQGRAEIMDILSKYLDSPYVILKRIAVYLLRIKGNQYPDLVETTYRTWKTKGWVGGSDEFEHFLDAQFGVLPSRTQEEVIKAIYQYEDEDEFAEWAGRAIEQSPDNFAGISKEEKKTSFAEEYEFRQLHRFAQWLTGGAKKRYEEISVKYEKPAPRLESGVVTTSWETEQSPIKIDELGKKTVCEVIQYLVDFTPEGESFRTPSREGLAQVLRTEITNRLEEFVENSSLFIRDDLPFIYHENYLRALDDAIKAGLQIRITKTLELCEFILDMHEDNFEKQQYESGLSHAKLAVAHFLEQFLRTKEPYADKEALDRIGQIILLLGKEEDDSYLDKKVDEQNPNELDTRTLNTNLDAATQSLNSIRGVAMHCLISFALYSERKRKDDGGEKDTPVMVSLAKNSLTEKLDKNIEPSLAVHSVLGWYFPQLMYLDKAWSTENLERIFPLRQEGLQYWIAAWSAYVRFSDVYNNVFPYLIEHYKIAIELLPQQKTQAYDRIDERLSEHLLKAFLFDLIDIESEDELLKSYFEKSSDEVRAHGIFWLSQVLGKQKPSVDDKVWIRIWNLWQWRVDEVSKAEDNDKYQNEITSYSRLLENVPIELDVLRPVLSQMIKFKDDGYFTVFLILNYLAANAEKHLKDAVDLLLEVIQKKQLLYLADGDRENIRFIFEQVKNIDDVEVKQKAVEIINILGERGDYEWAKFLDAIE